MDIRWQGSKIVFSLGTIQVVDHYRQARQEAGGLPDPLGPAPEGAQVRFLLTLRGRPLAVSIVTVEEVLEGAADEEAAFAALQRFAIQGLHPAQARRCALLQRRTSRRLGENEAWLVATAESIAADVVAADRGAFARLGARYLRFR